MDLMILFNFVDVVFILMEPLSPEKQCRACYSKINTWQQDNHQATHCRQISWELVVSLVSTSCLLKVVFPIHASASCLHILQLCRAAQHTSRIPESQITPQYSIFLLWNKTENMLKFRFLYRSSLAWACLVTPLKPVFIVEMYSLLQKPYGG